MFKINHSGYLQLNIKENLEQSAPFIRLIANGEAVKPTLTEKNNNIIRFKFEDIDSYVDVKVENKEIYTTYEVVDLKENDKLDIETLLWGPIEVEMTEVVGESVGVVQHNNKAFGMQVLNTKTLGGWPKGYEKFGYADEEKGNVTRYPYHECVAWPLKTRSVLQAYTTNWGKERFKLVMGSDIPQQVKSFLGDDARIIGSKIALFYCDKDNIFNTISEIEIGEGLPHPIIEGEWGKISNEATRSYLISNFDESDIEIAARHAKLAGFKYIYHDDPWKSWGHFDINMEGGSNKLNSIIKQLEEKENIRVGAHTLTNFIHGHDSYVTPKPDERLIRIGYTELTRDLDETSDEVYIKDDKFFNVDMSGRNIRECIIGKEIIKYVSVEKINENEYKLCGCKRGNRGTTEASFKVGEKVGRLSTHYYDTLFPSLDLQKEMVNNLVNAYNESGMKQISFDGLEGGRYLGYEDYGCNIFVDEFYKKLNDKENFVNDASIVTPYLWHIHTRMNWGEPWGEGMREGQMTIRYDNQDYFERNLLPHMFGWFILDKNTPLIDIEWMLSKAAGFDAGFALFSRMDQIKANGLSEELCKKINQWEAARLSGAFTQDQKKRLQVKENEWHLEEIEKDKKWTLQKVNYPIKPLIKKFDQFQPGSTGVDFAYTNNLQEQPFRFELQVLDGGKIVNPGFLLSKGSVAFNTTIESDQYLIYNSEDIAIKYDSNWNKIEEVKALKNNQVVFVEGYQMISLSADVWENENGCAQVRFITMGEPEDVFVGNKTTKSTFTIEAPDNWNLNEDTDMSISLEDAPLTIKALEFEINYDPDKIKIQDIITNKDSNIIARYKKYNNKIKFVMAFVEKLNAEQLKGLIQLKLKASQPQKALEFGITNGVLIDQTLEKKKLEPINKIYDAGITMKYKVNERLNEIRQIVENAKEGKEVGQYLEGALTKVNLIVDNVKKRFDGEEKDISYIDLYRELDQAIKILADMLISKQTGDINQDGTISLEDLALAAVNFQKPVNDESDLRNGDVDKDGKLGYFDIEFIMDKIL